MINSTLKIATSNPIHIYLYTIMRPLQSRKLTLINHHIDNISMYVYADNQLDNAK